MIDSKMRIMYITIAAAYLQACLRYVLISAFLLGSSVVGGFSLAMEWYQYYDLKEVQAASTVITSDASGMWGCGVFTSQGYWFQLTWPERI